MSASLGEIVACSVRVPVEVVKSRTQTASYGTQSSSMDAFRRVLAADGVRGLYRGFGMTIAREVRLYVIFLELPSFGCLYWSRHSVYPSL